MRKLIPIAIVCFIAFPRPYVFAGDSGCSDYFLTETFQDLKKLFSSEYRKPMSTTANTIEKFLRSDQAKEHTDLVFLSYAWFLSASGYLLAQQADAILQLFSEDLSKAALSNGFNLERLAYPDQASHFSKSLFYVFYNLEKYYKGDSTKLHHISLLGPFYRYLDPTHRLSTLSNLSNILKGWQFQAKTELYSADDSIHTKNDAEGREQIEEFYKQLVLRALGQKALSTSFLGKSQTGNQLKLVVFSTDPVEGGEAGPGGYYFKNVGTYVPRSKSESRQYQWNVNGQIKSVTVNYRRLPFKRVFRPMGIKPKYAQMLADKNLGGFILLPDHGSFGSELAGYYLDYYQKNGFNFSPKKALHGLKKVVSFVLERLTDGSIDYFVADHHHSYFGDQSLFNLPQNAIVFVGEKSSKSGRPAESVIILLSARGRGFSRFSTQDMRSALNSRPRPESQFIFINGVCHGHNSLSHMFTSVAHPAFLPLASQGSEDTFCGDSSTNLDHIIDGIRNYRTYKQIRRATLDHYFENELRASGATRQDAEDLHVGFLFPDEPQYIEESDIILTPEQIHNFNVEETN